MKILVVEDDTFIGESIKEYFELQNNKVDYFSSPKKAVADTHPAYYDIFLFDILNTHTPYNMSCHRGSSFKGCSLRLYIYYR
jgi:DNA-binding response OmpR family regulator